MKFGSPASIAGLPGNNACVKVGANRNFGADSSGVLAVSILKRKVNIAVGFNFASTTRPVSAYHFCSAGNLSLVTVNSHPALALPMRKSAMASPIESRTCPKGQVLNQFL